MSYKTTENLKVEINTLISSDKKLKTVTTLINYNADKYHSVI